MIMTTFGGNKGYVGYSMSKRAVNARYEGKLPKTDFKKEYGISEKLFKILKEIGVIGVQEWHHTSMYGNRTDFYGWNNEEDLGVWNERVKEIKSLARKIKSLPKMSDYPITREGMDLYTIDCDKITSDNKSIINSIKTIFGY